jgi:hypothetical protein
MRIFTKGAKKSKYHYYYFFWLINCGQNWRARVKLTCESNKNKNSMEIITLGAFLASAQSLPLRKLTHIEKNVNTKMQHLKTNGI